MINAETRNGNLFIQLTGKICPDKVAGLTSTLSANYTGSGNVFINTEKVTDIFPSSVEKFGSLLKQSAIPYEKIYLIGEKGFKLTDGTTRVITRPPKKDRCAGCKKHRLGLQKIQTLN